jgi:hypothetical protein
VFLGGTDHLSDQDRILGGFYYGHVDGPYTHPDDFRKIAGTLRFSDGTDADGWSRSARATRTTTGSISETGSWCTMRSFAGFSTSCRWIPGTTDGLSETDQGGYPTGCANVTNWSMGNCSARVSFG